MIAQYSYDEWGKLLGIETAEEGNEEQLSIAEINPLRYRGYYYDSETGMYYLQSRYYNPELCRFISADDFSYLDTSGKLNANAYIYCWNCPIAFYDVQGTTPELSINLADITSFIQNMNNRIKDGATKVKALIEKWSKLIDNFKNTLKIRYNAFIDKIEYYINYPDAVINDTLSRIFNRDVNIRFRLIELIREKTNLRIDLSDLKVDVDDTNIRRSAKSKSSSSTTTDDNNIVMAIIQGLVAAIELNWINKVLEFFGSSLDKLAEKSFEAVKQGSLILITTFNSVIDYFRNLFSFDILMVGESEYLKYAEEVTDGGAPFIDGKGVGKGLAGIFAFFNFILDLESAGAGAFSKTEDIVMASISLVTNIISILIPDFFLAMAVSSLGDIVPQIIILRKNGYIMPV